MAEGAEPVEVAPAAPQAPPREAAPDALPRPTGYRALQVTSLLLIATGVVVTGAVVQATPGILSGADSLADDVDGAVAILGWLVIGGLALLVGLLANLARAVVVREQLPESRYRGPSILALLVLAVIAANLAIVSAAGDVAALLGEGELTTLGTLVVLTVTQLGLLGAAALFVMAPRALAGVRLLPARGEWRSIGLGLLLSVPAWIGAQLIGVVVVYVLEMIGLQPEVGLAEEALSRANPVVLVLALVVVAPIAEEVFFRGVAYNAWLREYGASRALFGSAILFGFIHGSVFLFLPIVALGIVLALVYRSTGSLAAAIALHAAYNGITVALVLLVRFGVLDLPIT